MDFQSVLTAKGYSQRKLAQKVGISQSEISRMYNGIKPWDPKILELMEEWTNVDLSIKIPVCADCGGAHYTRCHSKKGTVVILGDSEEIVERKPSHVCNTQGAKRERVYRPVLSLEVKERIQASGATVEELIEAGLHAMEDAE